MNRSIAVPCAPPLASWTSYDDGSASPRPTPRHGPTTRPRWNGRGGTETGKVREEITTCCQHRLGATAARKPRVCLSHFLPAAIKTSHWLAVYPQRAGHAQQGTEGLLLKVVFRSRFTLVQCCFTSTVTVPTFRVGELRTSLSLWWI